MMSGDKQEILYYCTEKQNKLLESADKRKPVPLPFNLIEIILETK